MNQNLTRSSTRTVLMVIGGVLALVVIAGGAFALDIKHHQWKLWDEWECSQGEVPVLRNHGGGEYCLKEGARVPKGWHLDPLGNRPFDCTDRDGWVEIMPTDAKALAGLTCYPSGKDLPAGWQRAS